MDWIHCNKCFSQITATINLFLTTCGHMYCNNCLGKVDDKSGNCVICRSPCSVVKLEADMSPDVQEFFTDPEEMSKKMTQVLQFQKQHRKRLLSYLLQSTKKFYETRNELKKFMAVVQKQNIKLKQYEKRIEYLESERMNSSRQVSPFTQPVSPMYSNTSPNCMQNTPILKKPAKSTPYFMFQPNLITPTRLTQPRGTTSTGGSQKSNTSNKITSTVLTPPTPESPGSSQSKTKYGSGSPHLFTPRFLYCSGYGKKCGLKNNGFV